MAFTFFFRDIHTLEQAAKYLMERVQGNRTIKLWDAGCAMGPEPYTFLIVLAEKMGYFAFKKVMMDATDIDESGHFGEIITKGIYEHEMIKRTPEEVQQKYFQLVDEEKKLYKIDERIRSRLKYTQHDLLKLSPIGSGYNMIICKNVLLHFHYDQRVKVMEMYHSVLADKGLLVTEQTQELPKELHSKFKPLASDAHVYEKI